MYKVLVTEPIHEAGIKLLEEHFEVVHGTATDPETIIKEGQGCSGILLRVAKISAEIMDALPDLKVIAKHGIGLDSIDVAAATARGIAVVNAPTANINAVAEHSVMLMLAVLKNVCLFDDYTRAGQYAMRNKITNSEIKGKTVGLVGLGKIAKLVAKKISGFDVEILGSDPFVKQEDVESLGIKLVSVEELLQKSDIISLHTPLTAETEHMISTQQFSLMKPTAVVINASRGAVIDEAALVEAIRSKKIAGAGLDVFEEEPPQKGNPLFELSNVIASPHNAALTDGALYSMAYDAAQGIVELLSGQVPQYICNKEVLK